MFRRLAFITLMSIVVIFTTKAQTDASADGVTAAHCFSIAPGSIFDMLDTNQRLDMLDYFHADVDHPTANTVGGDSYIVSESPTQLTLVGGNGILYQLFVLNAQSASPVIGVIETVDTPIPDSTIRLYDSRWKELKGLMPPIELKNWVNRQNVKKIKEIEAALPFMLASMTYDDATNTITVNNNMRQYFVPTDTPTALFYLADSLTFSWDGSKFKQSK